MSSTLYFDQKDYSPLRHYNSLCDINLQGYYSKPWVRKHLKKTGLINKKGEIIPEDVWRKRVLNRERMEHASRVTANRIVQKAIEIKNLERAEMKRKLEEVAKKEMVARIRGKSAHGHRLPILWSSMSHKTLVSEEFRDRNSTLLSRLT